MIGDKTLGYRREAEHPVLFYSNSIGCSGGGGGGGIKRTWSGTATKELMRSVHLLWSGTREAAQDRFNVLGPSQFDQK